MAQGPARFGSQLSTSESVYRPISNWAIGGFLVSGSFAVLVLVNVLSAFVLKAPLFFYEWVIILPVAGVLLSWIALGKIRESEGTRAGLWLAQIGLWMGLVSGLGYFSYYYALRLAHIHQANQFLLGDGVDTGFFTLLKKAGRDDKRLDEAFFESLSPAKRSTLDDNLSRGARESMLWQLYDQPDNNGMPGDLTNFRNNYLVQAMVRGGKDTTIVPSTVKSWEYGSAADPSVGGYRVVRSYQIGTPEFNDEVEIVVDSFEAERAGQKRKWYVNLRQSKFANTVPTFTERGRGVMNLRTSAASYLQGAWLESLQQGRPMSVKEYEMLTAPTQWKRIIPEPDSDRELLRSSVQAIFVRQLPIPLNIQVEPEELPARWGIEEGRFWINLSFEMNLPELAGPQRMPPYILSGVLKAKLKTKEDPLAFASDAQRNTEWTVESIEFQRGRINRPR